MTAARLTGINRKIMVRPERLNSRPPAREIRIRDDAGVFRVIYVAKFAHAVYVLHCFRKTTQKTRKTDLDLAARRYRELTRELCK
jgi:phage-related protein